MADAANGGTEDVLVKEDAEVLKEEELALEAAVEGTEGGVAEKIDAAVEEQVEEVGVGESLNIPDGENSATAAAAVEEIEVPVESEAFETAPIPVDDGKGAEEILDPVVVEAGEESRRTASVVAKELEPPAVVEQEEIPESTGNPAVISVSARTVTPTSWRSCCGLFDALRRS